MEPQPLCERIRGELRPFKEKEPGSLLTRGLVQLLKSEVFPVNFDENERAFAVGHLPGLA